MKKLYIALVAMTLTACASQETQELEEAAVETVRIHVADYVCESETRTLITIPKDGTPQFSWLQNDTIGIYPNQGDQISFPIVNRNGNNATFNGGGWALKAGSTYAAYYPFSRKNFLKSNKEIAISMTGQGQNGALPTETSSPYDILATAGARPENGELNLEFQHMACLVQFTLTMPAAKLGIANIQLEAGNGEFITEGKLDISGAKPVIISVSTAKRLTLALTSAITNDTKLVKGFLFVLPVDLSSDNLKVRVTDSDGASYSADIAGKNFEAGKLVRISATPELLGGQGENMNPVPGTWN